MKYIYATIVVVCWKSLKKHEQTQTQVANESLTLQIEPTLVKAYW